MKKSSQFISQSLPAVTGFLVAGIIIESKELKTCRSEHYKRANKRRNLDNYQSFKLSFIYEEMPSHLSKMITHSCDYPRAKC